MTDDPTPSTLPEDRRDGTSPITLPLTSRRNTFGLLIGVVAAMLAAGLAIPVVVGEPTVRSSGAGGGSDLSLGISDTTTSTVAGDTSGEGPVGGGAGGGVGSGATGGLATGGGSGAGGATLTATDIGVTASTIKIGLLVPTSSTVGDTGDQTKAQEAEFLAYIDQINAEGGIHGRKITTVTATYDILDQDSGARKACLQLVDDEKVFAVFNTTGFGPPGALCLTREKQVPFLQGSGHPDEVYAQSDGLYSSTFDSQTRNFRNLVGTLERLGVLRGKKIGVLGTEWIGLRRETEEGVVQTLKDLGYDPFVYWLSGDPASSQSQIPIAVQQMKANGVQIQFMTVDFVSGLSFVQQADAQRFLPRYTGGDPWGWTTDYTTANMPDSFAGAISVTAMRLYDARAGVPEPALDAACAKRFEEATGVELDRADDPYALYAGSMFACGVVQRFARAATAAGPTLTRRGLVDAIAGLGTIEIPFAGGPATYSRTKLDGSNHYRPQQWAADCKCWTPLVPDFTEGTYR